MSSGRLDSVRSVERMFGVMEIIADSNGEASVSEIASRMGLSMSTIHRILHTGVAGGYVRQLPSRRYVLGDRLVPLGEAACRQLALFVQPALESLAREVRETANLAVLHGNQVMYAAQAAAANQAMRLSIEVGKKASLHNTSVGKAILAQFDDERVRALLAPVVLAGSTARGHASLDSLLADLSQIRERNFSVDDQEQEWGVRCYAVAVPDVPAPMAVSVSGPVARVDAAFGERAVPILQEAAARISLVLSG